MPDIVVYGLLTVAVATALVYAGVIIGRHGSGDQSKRGVNVGSPSPRRKKNKNKSRSHGSLSSAAADASSGADASAQQEVDDAELTEDDEDPVFSNSTVPSEAKEAKKEPKMARSPMRNVDMEPPLQEVLPSGEKLDDFSLVTKKKDKKKGSAGVTTSTVVASVESAKKNEASGVNGVKEVKNGSDVATTKKEEKKKKSKNGGGGDVAAEAAIEGEVVNEAVKELAAEEVSSAALTAAEEEIAQAMVADAASQQEGGLDVAATGAAADDDDDDGWNVVNKRAKAAVKTAETLASPTNEKKDKVKKESSNGSKEGKGSDVTASSAPSSSSKNGHTDGRVSPSTAPSPGPAAVTEVITIDLKHLGAVIGTKGSTRLALQKLFDTIVVVPKNERSSSGPIDVTITGQPEGIKGTVAGIRQLCDKGYATCLGGEGFSEGAVQVLPHFVSEIVGKSGHCARAIQEKMEVRLTIPHGAVKTAAHEASSSAQPVRIGIAGAKDKVKKAKDLIKELIKYHHTDITHPGLAHVELEDIPVAAHSHIIGKKGSEIARISSAYGVSVHIPYEHSVSQNIIIVGSGEGLKGAEEAVKIIVEKFELKERNAAAAALASGAAAAAPAPVDAASAVATDTEAEAEAEGIKSKDAPSADPAPASDAATLCAAEATKDDEKAEEKEEGEVDDEDEGGENKLQLDELGSHKHS